MTDLLDSLVDAARSLGQWETLRSTSQETIDYWTAQIEEIKLEILKQTERSTKEPIVIHPEMELQQVSFCGKAFWPQEEPNPEEIDISFVEAVESEVGMGSGGWDDVDPVDLCRAVLKVAKAVSEPEVAA